MLEWELQDGIAVITIDHPPVNAIDLEMLRSVPPRDGGGWRKRGPRAAVLTGTGSIFSAGADLVKVLGG